MKTQTYIDFKNYVKTNCVNKMEGSDYRKYEGTFAHLIYSAWYIFKHRLTEEQCIEYLKADYQATQKKFYSHGGYASVGVLKQNAKISKTASGWEYYPESEYEIKVTVDITGGIYYEDSENKWVTAVMKFYNYWKNLLDMEVA